MASVRPIGGDNEDPLGLRVIGCHDMDRHLVIHVEKQRAGERPIIRIILNDLTVDECGMHFGTGNPPFGHTLKGVTLPFHTPGMNGVRQRSAIQNYLQTQCPGLAYESQWTGEG
jgi:hypothetical protein